MKKRFKQSQKKLKKQAKTQEVYKPVYTNNKKKKRAENKKKKG